MDRTAKIVSAVFNPPIYATFFLLFLWASRNAAIGPGALAWAFITLLPVALLLLGMRLGVWSDIDLSRLPERRTYLPAATGSVLLGSIGVWALSSSRILRLAMASIFVWLLASTVISRWCKISLHVGATTGVLVLIAVGFGAWALALVWTPFVVAWARLRLRRHTLAQVGAAAALGILTVLSLNALIT